MKKEEEKEKQGVCSKFNDIKIIPSSSSSSLTSETMVVIKDVFFPRIPS